MDAHLDFRFPGKRLHLGVCGSVAAYRSPDLARAWQDAGLAVSVTLTPSARRFVTPLPFASLGASPVYTEMFDDPDAVSVFGHLDPGQTVHAMVMAPLSAATMARLAHGQADELLACQALAFAGPLVLAPAMNPAMWQHPATQANATLLRERGCIVVEPGFGRTACGDMGQGRLADARRIVLAGLAAVAEQDMRDRTVLVTLGPTREAWDDVRFWSNPSTGTMGAALAVAAWLRGATVHAVAGPGVPWLPEGERMIRHDVVSARQMFKTADGLWPACDMGLFTAAVADFSPVPHSGGKFKKSESPDGFSVTFAPNPDILRTLAHAARAEEAAGGRKRLIMGFAAESEQLEQAVRGKLASKKADMIVGNLIADGFGTTANTVCVVDRNGRQQGWTDLPKTELAQRLLTWLLSL